MSKRGYHIPNLEYMITTSCDLACPGCDRFIDHNLPFVESFDNIVSNIEAKINRMAKDKEIKSEKIGERVNKKARSP